MNYPLFFLEFLIQHYTKRLSEARDIKEKWFLRTTLINLKKSLQ